MMTPSPSPSPLLWEGPPIHDAVAVAWPAVPDLVTSASLRVDIETAGIHTRGQTVADREGASGRPPNAEVGLTIDRARLIDLVIDAVGRFA